MNIRTIWFYGLVTLLFLAFATIAAHGVLTFAYTGDSVWIRAFVEDHRLAIAPSYGVLVLTVLIECVKALLRLPNALFLDD
jgi:hypothetical protein